MSARRFALAAVPLLVLHVLATPTSAAGAPSPLPPAEEVLRHWADALGGRERLAAVRSVHLVSRLEMAQLPGSYESWDTARGEHRDVVEIPGLFRQENVFDGARGWVRDPSGKVHELAGADLADQVTTAYLATWSWLLSGRLAGEAVTVAEDDAHAAYVVTFRPKGGTPVAITLDRTTWLPRRQDQREADHTVTQTFDDWREVRGVKFPWRTRQSTGDPKYDFLFTVDRIELDGEIGARAFAVPEESVAPVRFAVGRSSAEFPFDLYGAHIFVPVTIDGKGPSAFIFDTGAEMSAIVRERADALGVATRGALEASGSGGTAEMALIPDVTLGLPGVDVPMRLVGAFPGADYSELFGTAVEGVVGYDVISRFVVRVDYENRRLTLYDPASFHYAGAGAVLPITFAGNDISIPGEIEIAGQPPLAIPLTIDSGSGGAILLNSPFVDAHHLLDAVGRTIPGSGHGLGGASSERVGRLASLRVGPYTIAAPLVSLSLATAGTDASPDRIANVGGQILSRFTVWFDYPDRRMILEPNARLHDGFDFDRSGLELAARGADRARITVERVDEETPASAAGIRAGDVVTRLGERSAASYRLIEIQRLLRETEGALRLGLERDGRPFEVTLTLRRRI
ncbi:MAG: aspartyl protease family protein [Thermoanaerobaculia bacterium]